MADYAQSTDVRPFPVSGVTVGLSTFPFDTTEFLGLLHLADKALYMNETERK